MSITRRAKVLVSRNGNPSAEQLARYLPANYQVASSHLEGDEPYHIIEGTDNAGWTMDDYVIPRLASGLIIAREITE